MDTELARTFMAIIEAGTFFHAAERLHVTQSTVSARVRSLEEQLGCVLFDRNKGGAVPTAAGQRFRRHAIALLQTVEHARQDVGIPDGFRALLTIGGRFGLWEHLLLEWLPLMRRAVPDVAVRAEIGYEEDLMQRLIEGRIDIGVMYTPQSRPGLVVERLLEEELILVSSVKRAPPEPASGYVYVDWGPEFRSRHSSAFPQFAGPEIIAGIGWLGLQHILSAGGAGYFPIRIARRHIDAGSLFAVDGAPRFSLPAYTVHGAEGDSGLLASALHILRDLARRTEDQGR